MGPAAGRKRDMGALRIGRVATSSCFNHARAPGEGSSPSMKPRESGSSVSCKPDLDKC